MSLFFLVVLSIWAAMHGYVFWRLSAAPWVAQRVPWWALAAAGILLWASYPAARVLGRRLHLHLPALVVEWIAANWMGLLFLLFSLFIILDIVTLGGWLLRRHVPMLRQWTALAALALSLIALVQGLRPPVVREMSVRIPNLPARHDGLVLVMVSDLHLGMMINENWMARVARRIAALEPDLIAVVGDLIDSDADRLQNLLPALRRLEAPLGVWAVTGNHEYYAGYEGSIELMREAGFRVLIDESAEAAPGLVIAGVDDLTARGQFGQDGDPVRKALENRPEGAVIFLSHSPLEYERASALGADLMLSGHTHNGQIWPFNYLVKSRYPLICGRYEVEAMTLIVGRGTGTWGPRMRLWRPSEIVRIELTRQ